VRSRLPRQALFPRQALALAAAGVLTASLAVAAAAPPAAAGPAGPAPAAQAVLAARPVLTAQAGAAAARPVLLITGDRLATVPGAGGRPATMLLPPAGGGPQAGGAFLAMGRAGHTTQVPAAALPFLGRGLDPALFDVAALRRAERGGRLPVRITFRGPVPRLPGVRITHAAAGTATGFLTAQSAPAFGAALSRQFTVDHERASYGTDGLFARGVSIALDGAAGPRPVRPRFVMRTVTIHGTDLAGRPDNGDSVALVSADNTSIIGGAGVFRHGTARVSTPAGRYFPVGLYFAPHVVGFDFAPQVTIPARGRSPRLVIAGQTVTSKITVATPRPGLRNAISFTSVLTGRRGPASIFTLSVLGVLSRQVNVAVNAGAFHPSGGSSLRTFTQVQLVSPPHTAVPYAYSLDFPGPLNQIPAQHYTVDPSSLATVTENYVQDRPSAGGWVTAGGTVPELDSNPAQLPSLLRLPGRQVQYLTADPSVLWLSRYVEFGSTFSGGQTGTLRSYRPGEQVTEDWGRYPLHPVPAVSLAGLTGRVQGFSVVPSAARTGDTLALGLAPFSDSTAGHQGGGFQPDPAARLTERYSIGQNGSRLAAGDAAAGIPPVRLSARPSVVRFTLAARRTGAHYVLSPASTTTWQWRSQRAPGATVPAPWACPGTTGTGNKYSG
jgi:hypothetical protein